MLQHYAIAREQRGNQRVDRREVGIVPRRENEHYPEGLTRDVAGEALLGVGNHRSEGLGGKRHHMARAIGKAS